MISERLFWLVVPLAWGVLSGLTTNFIFGPPTTGLDMLFRVFVVGGLGAVVVTRLLEKVIYEDD